MQVQKKENRERRKKGVVYGVILTMLGLAVYLNWSYVETPDELIVANQAVVHNTENQDTVNVNTETTVINHDDYFAQSRLTREKARDEAISILKDSLQNESASEEEKKEAAEQISKYADCSVAEARIESMIKAKGFPEAVVFLSEEGVNVIVEPKTESLESADAALIQDIVTSETQYMVTEIKIVEAAV